MPFEERIAKIEDTFLGVEDHGILTCWLNVDYGDAGHQSIGGRSLDEFDQTIRQRVGTAYGCEFVRRVLLACGVDAWEKLPGRTILAIQELSDPGCQVVGIAPLPTESGQIFLFEELRDSFSGGQA